MEPKSFRLAIIGVELGVRIKIVKGGGGWGWYKKKFILLEEAKKTEWTLGW
jgi:hypothetical protein